MNDAGAKRGDVYAIGKKNPNLPFHPAVRAWFSTTFGQPTPAQAQGWPAIAQGEHSLILAPTGSGKTLAAFLWGLDRLVTEPPPDDKSARTRLVYLSPLRALATLRQIAAGAFSRPPFQVPSGPKILW